MISFKQFLADNNKKDVLKREDPTVQPGATWGGTTGRNVEKELGTDTAEWIHKSFHHRPRSLEQVPDQMHNAIQKMVDHSEPLKAPTKRYRGMVLEKDHLNKLIDSHSKGKPTHIVHDHPFNVSPYINDAISYAHNTKGPIPAYHYNKKKILAGRLAPNQAAVFLHITVGKGHKLATHAWDHFLGRDSGKLKVTKIEKRGSNFRDSEGKRMPVHHIHVTTEDPEK